MFKFKWMKDIFVTDKRSHYEKGYSYVVKSWEKDNSKANAYNLWAEEDDQWNYDEFNKGMRQALLDLNVPHYDDPHAWRE